MRVKCDGFNFKFKGVSEEICSRDVIGKIKQKSFKLEEGGGSPSSGNFDNFIFKMVQSGAFWRFYLC